MSSVQLTAPAPVNYRSILYRFRGLLIPALLIALWQYQSTRGSVYAYTFVPLQNVWLSFVEQAANGVLANNWLASISRAGAGFAIGAILGITLGSIMALSRIADLLINPLYHALRQVPLLGWIPLISLVFGNNSQSKVFVIALAAFYPTVLHTFEGLRAADKRHMEVAQVFQAGRWQTFRFVTLPAALPLIFAGLMQATAFAWLSAIGSELFFNPGPGLGTLMLNAQSAMRMDILLLYVIVIALTGVGMNAVVTWLSQYFLRWRSTR
ncbi:MAG TPA: ABC transporter permease [Candidatus Methylacidiphilales bacterium]|nr:ABC transporter permease [Candidatus Methylacidiphilales bacterium]